MLLRNARPGAAAATLAFGWVGIGKFSKATAGTHSENFPNRAAA